MDSAFILVGGTGTRLRPCTLETPKPLLPIDGKPILEWTINWLSNCGLKNITLGIAYKPELFYSFVKKIGKDININFNLHDMNDTNSMALKKALDNGKIAGDNFMVINGDTIADIDLHDFSSFHAVNKSLATIAITPMYTNCGIVNTNGDKIISFTEKPTLNDIFINTGYYIFNKNITSYLDANKFEKELFPNLSRKKSLYAFKHFGLWYTFDSFSDFNDFNEVSKRWSSFKKRSVPSAT